MLVKTFPWARRIETRLLTKQQGKWAGYSYLWNDEQTDATLVSGRLADRVYPNKEGKPQSWHYPSRPSAWSATAGPPTSSSAPARCK